MRIHPQMNLGELAERMGGDPTIEEAEAMRALLLGAPYTTTEEVPEDAWIDLLEQAIS